VAPNPENNMVPRTSVQNLIKKFESKNVGSDNENKKNIDAQSQQSGTPKGNSILPIIQTFEKKIAENEAKRKKSESEIIKNTQRDFNGKANILEENSVQKSEDDSDSFKSLDDSGVNGTPVKMFQEFSNPYKQHVQSQMAGNIQESPMKNIEVNSNSAGRQLKDSGHQPLDLEDNNQIRETANFGFQAQQTSANNLVNQPKPEQYDRMLDDLSVDVDPALDLSTVKPVMNNPLGVNKSIIERSMNQSEMNISRKMLADLSYHPVEGEQWKIPIAENVGNQDMQFNLIEFESHLLSQRTEDTRDLSHMSLPQFKNTFYKKDNSLYLNMSRLNHSNIMNASQNKSMNRSAIQNKSLIKRENESKKEAPVVVENLLSELEQPNPKVEEEFDNMQLRATAKFGFPGHPISGSDLPSENPEMNKAPLIDEPKASEGQITPEVRPLDTVKKVISNPEKDMDDPEFIEDDKVDLKEEHEHKIRNSRGNLVNLSQLDISKISFIQDNFLDNDELATNISTHQVKVLLSPRASRFSTEKKENKGESDNEDTEGPKNNRGGESIENLSEKLSAKRDSTDFEKIGEQQVIHNQKAVIEEINEEEEVSKSNMQNQSQKSNPVEEERHQNSPSTNKDVSPLHHTQNENSLAESKGKLQSEEVMNNNQDNNAKIDSPNTLEKKEEEEEEEEYEKERNELINQMKHIYDEVRSKNEELNQYLNEVRFTFHQNDIPKQTSNQEHINKEENLKQSSSHDEILKHSTSHDDLSKYKKYTNPFGTTKQRSFEMAPGEKIELGNQRLLHSVSQSPQKGSFEYSFPVEQEKATEDRLGPSLVEKFKKITNPNKPLELQKDAPSYGENTQLKQNTSDYKGGKTGPIEPSKILERIFGEPSKLDKNVSLPNILLEGQNQSEEKPTSRSFMVPAYSRSADNQPNTFNSESQKNQLVDQFTRKDGPTERSFNATKSMEDEVMSKPTNTVNPNVNQSLIESRNIKPTEEQSNKYLSRSFNLYTNPFKSSSENSKPNPINLSSHEQNQQENILSKQNEEEASPRQKPGQFTPSTVEDMPESITNSGDKGQSNFAPNFNRDEEAHENDQNANRVKTEIKIKLKLKKKNRVKPQIQNPKPIYSIPVDASFDVNMTICQEDISEIRVPIKHYHSNREIFNRTIFGFQVKKDKFIRGIDQRKIEKDILEIICINCQEFIKVTDVDEHSKVCYQTVQKPADNQSELTHFNHTVQELNQKIHSIVLKLQKKLEILTVPDLIKNSVQEILIKTQQIINEDSNLELIDSLITDIQMKINLIEQQPSSSQNISILIFLHRIALLSKEKYSELELVRYDDVELIQLQQQIQAYERETMKQKAELELWKYQAEMMHEIKINDDKNLKYVKAQYRKDLEILSQIQSDIDYSDGEESCAGTSVTSAMPFNFESTLAYKSAAENAENEKMKIKFYSTAVNLKLTLPPNHPGKDILISDLYEKLKNEKVPPEEWNNFLKKEFGM